MTKIILASRSPRRKELLEKLGLVFDVVPSDFDEKLDDSRSPEEVAKELALGKAKKVAEVYPNSIIIGSDTIVTIEGKQLEKPTDSKNAVELLQLLSGKTHEVTTGLAIILKSQDFEVTVADTARVRFKEFDEVAVKKYVETGDPLDKAGAYGIQSGAAPLIEYIKGNYDTIVGLPTKLVAKYLSQLGVKSKLAELKSPVKEL